MNEDAQYRLIHHEYAGLAKLEIPNGSQSQYPFSDQLSAYLVNTLVRRLAIKPPAAKPSSAGSEVNTVSAIYYAAPGLTSTRIANGIGNNKTQGNLPCTLLYKEEASKVKLTLIVKNQIIEMEFDVRLIPYEDIENQEVLTASYNQELGQFSYFYEFGSMTNQYTGSHGYQLNFAKKSGNSFSISYSHDWADDDGSNGIESYSCLLGTEK